MPGAGGQEGRASSKGQHKASSSNKCQHHHQLLLPMKPQVQTGIQNMHLKVTIHMSSPIALLPARQDTQQQLPVWAVLFLQFAVEGYSYPRALLLCLFC